MVNTFDFFLTHDYRLIVPSSIGMVRHTALQPETGLGGEPEELFADSSVTVPMPRIPFGAAEVIPAVEDLAEGNATELGNGEEGRGFHLHRDAALLATAPYLLRSLAIDGIGSPGLRQQ